MHYKTGDTGLEWIQSADWTVVCKHSVYVAGSLTVTSSSSSSSSSSYSYSYSYSYSSILLTFRATIPIRKGAHGQELFFILLYPFRCQYRVLARYISILKETDADEA